MFPGGGDPFTNLFGMMNNMDRMMNQMLQDPFLGMHQAQMPPQAYQQHPQTAPRVEEVPHGAAAAGGARRSAGPIVEEPDEQGHQHRSNAGAAPQPRQQYAQPQQAPPAAAAPVDPFGTQLNNPFGALLGGGMFGAIPGGVVMRGNGNFFSSSTVISSGPGGVYHSSTTSRQAPGGVRETRNTVRDTRTGYESMTIARGLGEQERVVTRTRDANGQLITEEHNAGIDPSSAHEFDQQWVQHAQQTMPTWMQEHSTAQRIGPGGGQQQQQLALPPATGAAPQYGGQQQQQQFYQQRGAGYGQQGAAYNPQQQQGRGGSGTNWPGGYHV